METLFDWLCWWAKLINPYYWNSGIVSSIYCIKLSLFKSISNDITFIYLLLFMLWANFIAIKDGSVNHDCKKFFLIRFLEIWTCSSINIKITIFQMNSSNDAVLQCSISDIKFIMNFLWASIISNTYFSLYGNI